MTVNKENMRAFVKALQSGEYSQCQGSLRAALPADPPKAAPYATGRPSGKNGYCCLGVATDLAIKAGAFGDDDIPYEMRWGALQVNYVDLVSEVMDWLGVDDRNPLLDLPQGERLRAISCNDVHKLSFFSIGEAFRRTFLPEDVVNYDRD